MNGLAFIVAPSLAALTAAVVAWRTTQRLLPAALNAVMRRALEADDNLVSTE